VVVEITPVARVERLAAHEEVDVSRSIARDGSAWRKEDHG
jgi:hypothetical protein